MTRGGRTHLTAESVRAQCANTAHRTHNGARPAHIESLAWTAPFATHDFLAAPRRRSAAVRASQIHSAETLLPLRSQCLCPTFVVPGSSLIQPHRCFRAVAALHDQAGCPVAYQPRPTCQNHAPPSGGYAW